VGTPLATSGISIPRSSKARPSLGIRSADEQSPGKLVEVIDFGEIAGSRFAQRAARTVRPDVPSLMPALGVSCLLDLFSLRSGQDRDNFQALSFPPIPVDCERGAGRLPLRSNLDGEP
jgi:hypothetical protein